MKKEFNPLKVAIPAASLSLLAPVAAFAAEGTGRVSNNSFHICSNIIHHLNY